MAIHKALSRLANVSRRGFGFDGAIDMVAGGRVRGWLCRRGDETPVVVDCHVNGTCIARGVRADAWRPDVREAGFGSGKCGFEFELPATVQTGARELRVELTLSQGGRKVLARKVKIGGEATAGLPVPRPRPPAGAAPPSGTERDSTSTSPIRLERLKLERLPGAKRRPAALHGLSVLDLGCDDGSLCLEAVRQGARRVVGIERDRDRLEIARRAVPDAEFRHGSWWDMPDETFDAIFFLSLLHYEQEPKRLLSRIVERLNPRGVLILECGHLGDSGARRWKTVRRSDGVRRYPTLGLLTDDLLGDYAVRRIGPGTRKADDKMPRCLFHCTPRRPTAMIVTAPSGHGKSNLAYLLRHANIPGIATDELLSRLSKDDDYAWRPLAAAIRQIVGNEKPNWGAVGRIIAEDPGLVAELCETIIGEIPVEAPIFTIEGEVLRHKAVQDRLGAELRKRSIRPWISQPL